MQVGIYTFTVLKTIINGAKKSIKLALELRTVENKIINWPGLNKGK